MSLFGTKFSFNHLSRDFDQKSNSGAKKKWTPATMPKRALLMGDCTTQKTEPDDSACVDENLSDVNTKPKMVDGQRVLRPWLNKDCPCDFVTSPPDQICDDPSVVCETESKLNYAKPTECGSVLISVTVNGGIVDENDSDEPKKLRFLIELPECDDPCCDTEIALQSHYVLIGEGKCEKRCSVECEFASLVVVSETPSTVIFDLVFSAAAAPVELTEQTEGPANCPLSFEFVFEIWRRKEQGCVDAVETIVAQKCE